MSKVCWYCVIGPIPEESVPPGADFPPRVAAREQVEKLTGQDTTGITSSGWISEEDSEAIRHLRGIQRNEEGKALQFCIPPTNKDGKCSGRCPLCRVNPETSTHYESRRCGAKLSDHGVPAEGCPNYKERCAAVDPTCTFYPKGQCDRPNREKGLT